jgi:transformation/transcription domain-associated protein
MLCCLVGIIANYVKSTARHFLIMILDAIAEKFKAMSRQYENAVKQSRLNAQSKEEGNSEEASTELVVSGKKDEYDEIDIFMATPIKTSNPRERGADPVSGKHLVLTCILLFYFSPFTLGGR